MVTLPENVNRSPVSVAAVAQICRDLQKACVVSLLNGEQFQEPVAELYPIDWVWQCAEAQILSCSQFRMRNIVKVLPSPPAPLPPLMIGRVEYAIICDDHSGECGWKYYTDFSDVEWPVWHAEGNCYEPLLPLPDEGPQPPPPPCDPIAVDAFSVAIAGEIVRLEPSGTIPGCIVPKVAGAYPPSHRNFNRAHDYAEVTADRVMARRNCRGSYRVELRSGRVCDVGCSHVVDRLMVGIGGEFGCYIRFNEPTCQ